MPSSPSKEYKSAKTRRMSAARSGMNDSSTPASASFCCTFFDPAKCIATEGLFKAFDCSINNRAAHSPLVG